MYCPILISPSMWWMQHISSVVDVLCWNPHWWSQIILSTYGVNLETRILDKILHVIDNSDKVKVKLSLCFNWAPCHEGILGSGGIAPCILDLGIRWKWVVSFMPQLLYPPQGKSLWYPLDRRLGNSDIPL
jgi:hypothetical protein